MSNIGTLIQLVSTGASTVYLVLDPEITFFKLVYVRHTNFAFDEITQNFKRLPKFGNRVKAKIAKLGDLMYKTHLVSELPELKPTRTYQESVGTAELILSGTQIASINIISPGQGYLYPPDVIIVSNTGIGAIAEAKIDCGIITEIIVLAPGICYTINDTIILKGGTPIHTIAWSPAIGYTLINNIEIDIGYRAIDTQTGMYMIIKSQLQSQQGKVKGLRKMVGDVPEMTNFINNKTNNIIPERTIYSPLLFWYCKGPENAIPLCALQYHPVDIYATFNPVEKCIRRGATWFAKINAVLLTDIGTIGIKLQKGNIVAYIETENIDHTSIDLYFNYQDFNTKNKFVAGDVINVGNIGTLTILNGPFEITEKVYPDPILTSSTLYVTYIQLDRIELTKFAQLPHEYIVTQVQCIEQDIREPSTILDIIKTNVVTEYFWASILNENVQRNYWTNFTDNINQMYSTGNNFLISSGMTINDVIRIPHMPFGFYNYIQPYNHHSRIPVNGINVYCFALNPEKGQPSGAMNFSILNNKKLTLNYDISKIPTYAQLYLFFVNLNVLRIKNGVGGIMFYN